MGSATQDVFAQTDAELITIRHGKQEEELLAYPLGTKILISDLEFQIGGGGTNAACTFARQGLRTGFIGKLGRDPSGYAVFAFLKEEGIEFLGATGTQTGYSIILDSEEDDRTILTFKGSNNHLGIEEVAAFEATWLYCSSMVGTSATTMERVAARMKVAGSRVAFNPSAYQAKKGLDALEGMLASVEILILNREEIALLTGTEDLRMAKDRVLAKGPSRVLITDGANGATLHTGTAWIHTKPRQSLSIVETTGAGDAFASGFIAGLARGFDDEHALRLGMLNAEHVIAEYGAKNHILTKAESDALLATDDRTITRGGYE